LSYRKKPKEAKMYCEIIANLQMARAAALDLQVNDSSRELSLVLTKIDEAILWRHEDIRLKTQPINISNA
jgi:hypothetical protein